MAYDFDTPVRALRDAVGAALSMDLAEVGNGVDLSHAPQTFCAYRLADTEVRPYEPAIMDTTLVLGVEVYYVTQREPDTETIHAVRQALSTIAGTAEDFGAWPQTVAGLVLVDVVGYATGDMDRYGEFFQRTEANFAAGHVTVQMTVYC